MTEKTYTDEELSKWMENHPNALPMSRADNIRMIEDEKAGRPPKKGDYL